MNINEKKHFAVITGASSGIGGVTAKLLAKNGIIVIMGGRSKSNLQKIEGVIKSDGGIAISFYLDFNEDDSIKSFLENVNKIGSITTLINNAGFGKFDKIDNASISDWDEMMNVNLRGAFMLSKAFIPEMKKQKYGNLLFINSVAGRYGYPFSAAYVATKYGMRGLADSLRNELRQDGIRVSSIYPGAVDSNFWDDIGVDFPKNEMMNPLQIAETILFTINQVGNGVLEDIVIRRTKGDF